MSGPHAQTPPQAVDRYRDAVLQLAAAGSLAAAVTGLLSWLMSFVAILVLVVVSLRLLPRVPAWSGTAAVAALAALAIGHHIDQRDVPPAMVELALLCLLLGVGCWPYRMSRRNVDALLVAAVGVAVVAASAAVGRAPAVPMLLCAVLVVPALWHRQRSRASDAAHPALVRTPKSLVGAVVAVGALGMLASPVPGSLGLAVNLFNHGGASRSGQDYIEPADYNTSDLNLEVRGQLSNTPELAVSADAPTLWRGDVYATYTGTSWSAATTALGSEPTSATGSGQQVLLADGIDPVPVGAKSVTVSVEPLDASYDGTVYAPGVLQSVDTGATAAVLARDGAAAKLTAAADGTAVPFTESVVLPVSTSTTLASAHGTDPSGWTQLPSELPQRVRTLAATITAGASSRSAAVDAVTQYLLTHERYTLAAPEPGAHQDAVDAFLFSSHEGFCEQFASAETVLLRAVGIPARLVTGYGYGALAGNASRQRIFTAADAHAWVEVYYGGIGWSPSDPTANAQLVSAHQSLFARLRSLFTSLGHTPARRAGTAGGLALLLAATVLVVLRVRRMVSRRRSRRGMGPVTVEFAKLQRRYPRPPATTPREYVATLPVDLDEELAAWEAELFGRVRPADAQSAAAVRAVAALRRRSRSKVG